MSYERHYEFARRYLPGGVSATARANAAVGHPLYVERGDGARVADIEGRVLIDMCVSHGAALLGHNHPAIKAAVREALMAKAATRHFTRTIAAELAPHHINVNQVAPGWVNTPGELEHCSEAQLRAAGAATIPWGRLAAPDAHARQVHAAGGRPRAAPPAHRGQVGACIRSGRDHVARRRGRPREPRVETPPLRRARPPTVGTYPPLTDPSPDSGAAGAARSTRTREAGRPRREPRGHRPDPVQQVRRPAPRRPSSTWLFSGRPPGSDAGATRAASMTSSRPANSGGGAPAPGVNGLRRGFRSLLCGAAS
jgi:hypothetical protein